MCPPKFGHGLNVSAKRKARAFDDSETPVEEDTSKQQSTYLSSLYQKNVEKLQQSALDQDPTVFEYDAIYDAMKAKTALHNDAKKKKDSENQPKYVNSLLRNSQLRKLEQFRVEKRKRERESQEDETLQSKEVFVTKAYQDTLEKVRQLEKEEEEREKQDALHRSRFGLSGFYHTYLSSTHRDTSSLPIVQTEPEPSPPPPPPTSTPSSSSPTSIPSHVSVNVSGDVVDKRDLLHSGLNVVRTKQVIPPTIPTQVPSNTPPRPPSPPPPVELKDNQAHVQDARERYLARRAAKASNNASTEKK